MSEDLLIAEECLSSLVLELAFWRSAYSFIKMVTVFAILHSTKAGSLKTLIVTNVHKKEINQIERRQITLFI